MFFSIIIPVYNVERWLAQCLDSVLSQDFTDYEIIVIDDCSPDESYKIYDSYAKKHNCIRVIKHEVNKKLGGVRNTGIRAAQGEWILFLDSDDLMARGALQFYHEKALITQDGYFSGICDRIDENSDIIDNSYYKFSFSTVYDGGQKVKLSDFFRVNVAMLWCKCYKKTFLLNNKIFFNENVLYEDMAFNAQSLLIQPNFICYNMVCLHYRENLSSITQNATGVNQVQKVNDWFKEINIFHDLILKNSTYSYMGTLVVCLMFLRLHIEKSNSITKFSVKELKEALKRQHYWDKRQGVRYFIYAFCILPESVFIVSIKIIVTPLMKIVGGIRNRLRFTYGMR